MAQPNYKQDEEMTDKEIDYDLINKQFKEAEKKDFDEVLTERLSSCTPETELQTFVIETLKNRKLITTNFKSKLDKVTLLEVIEYLISFRTSANPFIYTSFTKYNDYYEYSHEFGDILPIAFESLYSECHELIKYIRRGAYLYQSPSHESPPIIDTDKRYQQILTWKPFLVDKDETTAPELSSIQAYTPCDFRSLYVSRSGLNQMRLFSSSSTNETDHELNVRKKAYRSYLEYGLPDFGDITSESPDDPTIIVSEKEPLSKLWEEVTVSLLANHRIALKSDDNRREFSMFDLGLVDKRTNKPNVSGRALVRLSERRKYPLGRIATEAEKNVMKKLRASLKFAANMNKNPFTTPNESDGWKPRFTLIDSRNAADVRARQKAIHVPYDDSRGYDQEHDAAGDFLREHEE